MEWSFQAEIQPDMSRGVERESPYCFRGAVGELGKYRWWERALFSRKWVWTLTFIHSTTNTCVSSGCQVCASCLGYKGGHGGSWVWRRSAGSGHWGGEGTAVERVRFWEPLCALRRRVLCSDESLWRNVWWAVEGKVGWRRGKQRQRGCSRAGRGGDTAPPRMHWDCEGPAQPWAASFFYANLSKKKMIMGCDL